MSAISSPKLPILSVAKTHIDKTYCPGYYIGGICVVSNRTIEPGQINTGGGRPTFSVLRGRQNPLPLVAGCNGKIARLG